MAMKASDLRAIRLKYGMTTPQFAKLLGQSDSRTLRRLESGECEIRKATAILALLMKHGDRMINRIEDAAEEVDRMYGDGR